MRRKEYRRSRRKNALLAPPDASFPGPIPVIALFADPPGFLRLSKPAKSAPRTKVLDLEMCKSQNWNQLALARLTKMLIPGKLHNWLLFRTLKLRFCVLRNRPLGLYAQPESSRVSLPQAFPQDEVAFPPIPQIQLPTVLTDLLLGETLYASYASEPIPPSASDSNLVQCLRKAIFTRPIGPLRCLAIRISARPCSSGSSCL